MTRCSDLALACVALLVAPPAWAEPLVSDAFGLYDPASAAPGRRDWAGMTVGKSLTEIAPKGPDRLLIYAGPKSLVAGKDRGHVVAIVVDRFGNLVADGTAATITLSGAAVQTVIKGGIADLLVPPRTKAEDVFVGVTAGDRQSPQAMLTSVAEIASIHPAIQTPLPDVASDTAFEVRSTALVDRYGNPVPKGTGASVILQHADGSYSVGMGQALQNSALVRFIARDIPGPAQSRMTIGAQSSPPVPITIHAPAPSGLPVVEMELLPAIGAVRVTLGPFLTTEGYALTDGAQVTVTAAFANGPEVAESAWVQDGEVNLLLPIADPGAVTRVALLSPLGPMDVTAAWLARAAQVSETAAKP